MKQKLVVFFLALTLFIAGNCVSTINVFAEDSSQDVDISEIWTEDALIGYATPLTRGIYLFDGYSIINDAGSSKIGAGGFTNAAVRCTVSVNAIVEKKVSGSWSRVTSWTATNTNALTAGVSKTLSVSSGYYYRVRSVHRAATDGSSSCTSSLWM